MRTLFHFPLSPFSRCARLALRHKKLEVTLKDGRADVAVHEEAKRLWPLRTVPVLVEPNGRALGDSLAIAHYLDAAYPDAPRLWPADPGALFTALEVTTLVNGALDALINTATRYYATRTHAEWPPVQREMVGRAQSALDALGERAAARGTRTLTDAGWCAADMWLFSAAVWLEGLPARKGVANVDQLLSLAWVLPAPIRAWADAFRAYDDHGGTNQERR
jgi:glutathione S-transferase